MLKDQVEKIGEDRNPVRQFFHLFASGVKEREDLETILRNITTAKVDLTVLVQFVLIGIGRNIEAISSGPSNTSRLWRQSCLRGRPSSSIRISWN
jgi:hypothetical protein